MNRERILEIADDIEFNGDYRPTFQMDLFFEAGHLWKDKGDWCNTSGCIAGYVCTLKLPNFSLAGDHETDAARWLGLSDSEAADLFFAHYSGIPIEQITAKMAVVCLRAFAASGEVDWATAVMACTAPLPVEEFA